MFTKRKNANCVTSAQMVPYGLTSHTRLDSAKSAINDSRRCNKKPLRFFTGIKIGQPSEWNVRIHCHPIDEAGHRIYAAENKKHERENHDKGFLFVISPDRIKILEIKYIPSPIKPLLTNPFW